MLTYRSGEFGFRHFALGAALTGVSALAIIVVSSAHAQVRKAIEVPQTWLERNCLDKGRGDLPLHGAEFEACVRKQASALPALDPKRREWFGEQYDPAKYVACRIRPGNRTNSACDIHILRRREWPEYWPEGAKRVKWPDPPKESVYRRGMKPKEYWEALCKAEAGEFVYRTVKDVDAIYGARPIEPATDAEYMDRFVLEDPFSHTDLLSTRKPQDYVVQPFIGTYRSLELPDRDAPAKYLRFQRSEKPTGPSFQTNKDGQWIRIAYIVDRTNASAIVAKHAYIWRGINRTRDRELGIAGGELAVVEIASGEVLGIRRGFARSGQVPNSPSGFWWLAAQRCPAPGNESSNMAFLRRVLLPRSDINANVTRAE